MAALGIVGRMCDVKQLYCRLEEEEEEEEAAAEAAAAADAGLSSSR